MYKKLNKLGYSLAAMKIKENDNFYAVLIALSDEWR